ncbi:tripartite tricarboxylate transporter TctB family protein [Pollutimonas sp. H1-120]|uniref:tripartite tricarboxylate transporter TctB family protein n=1 Tax=Pollutimonas sp. H1-120 TaxID=3148824 RepID=UPI003B517D94
MKISNLLAGLLIGLAGIAIIWYAQTLPLMPGQDVGPGMFPTLIGAGLVICAVLLARRDLRAPARSPWLSFPPEFRHARTLAGFLLVPTSLILYVWFSESLGFIPAAFLLQLALYLVFRVRLRTAIPVAIAGALVIHFLFYKLLEVPLPWGILDSIAW